MREPSRETKPQPAVPGHHASRAMLRSLIAEPTAFLDLSHDFIQKLRAVAPRRRRPKLRYAGAVLAVAGIVLVAVLGPQRLVHAMLRPDDVKAAQAKAAQQVAPPPPPAQEPSVTKTVSDSPAPSPGAAPDITVEAAPTEPAPSPICAPQPPAETAAAPAPPTAGNVAHGAVSAQKPSKTPRKPHRRAPR